MKKSNKNYIYFLITALLTTVAFGTLSDLTHYENTIDLNNGNYITIISDMEYDPVNDWNVFYHNFINESGETINNIQILGDDYVGGGLPGFDTTIMEPPLVPEEFIEYGNGLFHDGTQLDENSASTITGTHGLRDIIIETVQGNTYHGTGLSSEVPEPVTIATLGFGAAILYLAKKKQSN